MDEILIGIDDTDNPTSPGTGRLARDLCAELVKKGLQSLGVTRHQFLVDKAIPYTSHNSGACIAVAGEYCPEIIDYIFEIIAVISADGSDPGVCIALKSDFSNNLYEFGRSAQTKVLEIEQAFNVAKGTNIKLHGLGGNCQGVIGALSAAALRSQGNDGRFIDMPGLRELPRRVNRKELEVIGIELKHEKEERVPKEDDIYDTLDWVRPRLINNKPVLHIKWSKKENVWIPLDNRKKETLQHST